MRGKEWSEMALVLSKYGKNFAPHSGDFFRYISY
ncbi:unknown [[Mannheimia] succiniciproducens MBEL55E]|uniref:Uncharacterized protein n=1 Tax=Mannheimia succiniciproducens (strain KCTC 0769BP / MBEL55E) TaxID=221988 RepID=Q65RD6_MANSM|nr:unknown [[Mannheimia] succiniciproducens MBEL55E]